MRKIIWAIGQNEAEDTILKESLFHLKERNENFSKKKPNEQIRFQ